MKRRVVVADDESIIRMDLIECLTAAGYDVVGQAAQGQAALKIITDTQPDVAILDVRMPLLDGIEVARAVRSTTPVVLLTAFGQPEIVAQATDAGVMGYLVKPFTESEVVAAIEVAVSRFSDFQELVSQRDALVLSLETRKVLDRAKGLMQEKFNMTEPETFRWIQKAAMDRRLSIQEVAEGIIAEFVKP
ncbi:MAG: response regulator [Actinomycetes bacterium]